MLAALVVALLASVPQTPYLHMPSVDTYATHNPYGTTILPEGRLLRPAGWPTAIGRDPYGMTLSTDGRQAFVACSGSGSWITDWDTKQPKVITTLTRHGDDDANGGGCVFTPDGAKLFWSSGETGEVYEYDARTHVRLATIKLNTSVGGRAYTDSYISAVAISADGKEVYCADETNFRLAVIDVAQGKVAGSIPVGRYPVALAVDGNRVYVANIGWFRYSAIPKGDGTEPDKRGLTFPPFGLPSKEAENGVHVEGRQVSGLGSPLSEEAFSVYGIDVSDPSRPKQLFAQKTGDKFGARRPWGSVVGGSAPSYLLAGHGRLYVSNNNDDSVQALDPRTGRVLATTSLEPSSLIHGLRGINPSGLALSSDGSRLYVAESGLNSIGEIDTRTMKVIGLIPTAWYPYRVQVSSDGKTLGCICFKGFGNGPKGSKNAPSDPFVHLRGSFHTIPVPADSELSAMTQTVLENNGIVDNSGDREKLASPVWSSIPGIKSQEIKYCVFIVKENHTYDTIFDRVPGANDDPSLLRWGLDQHVSAPNQPTLDHVGITVNHNRIAQQFTVSDNFYVEPEASGVGHRWMIGVQPNNFCQMVYSLGWDFKLNSTAPGRLASFGSNASIAPEDYPEEGTMWHHFARHKVSFRNYGEGFEFAGVLEDDHEEDSGGRERVNIPMPKELFDNTCRNFPVFNMNIPDPYKAELFEKDVQKNFLSGKKPFPSFTCIALSNDHPAGPNVANGHPYAASWMADDDLGFGKIVDFLSHTPYWKNMAIFVTEDDAGGEADHIDAQRSVMLIISPYVKHGYVSHRHTTVTSVHRTMYEIFGLPPLNMFDALSNDFSDCFTDKPDFTPYTLKDVDHRLYDYAKVRAKADPDFERERHMPNPVPMDHWGHDDDDK